MMGLTVCGRSLEESGAPFPQEKLHLTGDAPFTLYDQTNPISECPPLDKVSDRCGQALWINELDLGFGLVARSRAESDLSGFIHAGIDS